jgi:hypothetical protein
MRTVFLFEENSAKSFRSLRCAVLGGSEVAGGRSNVPGSCYATEFLLAVPFRGGRLIMRKTQYLRFPVLACFRVYEYILVELTVKLVTTCHTKYC